MKELLFDEEDNWFGDYLKFMNICHDDTFVYSIINNDEELLGRLEKIRVGQWMSWCLLLEEGCYLSAGCQDEVRQMTKKLNARLHKPVKK